MNKRHKVRERTPVLHRVCSIALLVQLAYGGLMTLLLYSAGALYGVLAAALLLLSFVWFVGRDGRGARITVRVTVGVVLVFCALPLFELVLAGFLYNWQLGYTYPLNVGAVSLPALLWIAPVMGYMARCPGRYVRHNRYDRGVACVAQLWITVDVFLLMAVDKNANVDVNWALVGSAAYTAILAGVVLFTTVTVWLCALVRPREKAPKKLEAAEEAKTTLDLEE
ncbi:MAG: hypothetical protein E7541_03900 [Ruminococcaceae bacterium]|nr:hypothetical protein [Oscillospiraceae bacterium]